MNTTSLIKKFISRGAVIYTAISVGMMLLALMTSANPDAKVISPQLFLLIALYSYIASLGSTLYGSGYFSAGVARLIHAACYNIGLFCFLLFAECEFFIAVILTVAFAILYTVSVIISNVFKKSSNAKKDTKQVSNEKRQKSATKEKAKPQSTYTNRFS